MRDSSSLTLVEPDKDDFGLTEKQRQFVEEFFAGEHAGNATRAYQQVFGTENYNTASASASTLLRHRKVKRFLERLHQAATAHAVERKMLPWVELVPLAQSIVVATAQGKLRNRLAFEAAVHVLDRALGRPTERHQLELTDESRVTKALRALSTRMERAGGDQ